MKTDISYGDKEVDNQLADALCVAADRFEAWAEHMCSIGDKGDAHAGDARVRVET